MTDPLLFAAYLMLAVAGAGIAYYSTRDLLVSAFGFWLVLSILGMTTAADRSSQCFPGK